MLQALVLLFVLLSVTPAWAATYYATTTGSGSTCSEAAPCSVSGGLAKVEAGDTLYFRAGTYATNLALSTNTVSGTSNNYVTLAGFPGETVTFQPTADPVSWNSSVQWIIFDNLIFDGINSAVDRGWRTQNPKHIIIRNVEVKRFFYNGIWMDGVDDVLIEDSKFYDGRTDCGPGVSGHRYYGLYLSSGKNVTIRRNEFYNMPGGGIHIYNGSSSNPDPSIVNLTISRNHIHDTNFCVTSTVGGILLQGANGRLTQNVMIDHNLIVHNGSAATHGSAPGIRAEGRIVTASIVHNVIYNNKNCNASPLSNCEVQGWGFGIRLGAVGGFTPTGVVIRNNVNTGNEAAEFVSAGSPTVSNNACTGSENCGASPHAISGLTDILVSTTDFTLKSGSSAINAGVAIAGFTTNGLPDIGAYESFGCTATALASGNVVDVTCQMSANLPIQPATGMTTWTVKFGGAARTTVSASKLSGTDSVVRIQYDGAACSSSDVMTVDFTSGNVTDSARIGNATNQKLFSFTGLAVNESACTGGGGPPPPSGTTIIYHLNDASLGVCCADSSGNANHATVTGTPTLVNGSLDGALDFADQVDDFITAPWGSGVNPTEQSSTVCILVSPDSITNQRFYAGVPFGTNQRSDISIFEGTWVHRVQSGAIAANNDFPVSAGWAFPCIVFDASADVATLWVNAVKGTSTTGDGRSIKTMTSFTWAGNWTFGKASGFATSLSPGGVIDEIFVYPTALNQTEMTELWDSVRPSSPPPPTSSREQKDHKFQRPFKKAGAAEDLRGVDQDGRVSRGGYVDVVIQLDCTGDDCPSFAPRIHRSIDGGATYAQINDVCGVICFGGASTNPDLVSADVDACLTGALTPVSGPTNFTSAAVPNVALLEDHCIALRYKLKVAADATVGQEIYLKVFDQNGNELEGGYTPALGAKLTVKDYANGGGF